MLSVKVVAEVLGTTEAKVRAAARECAAETTGQFGVRGKSGMYYRDFETDRIKAKLAARK